MVQRVLVVAFGNTLMGDDGVGPAVIARLRELGVSSHIRLVDGGTDATILASLWNGEERVVILDALTRGAAPGTIHYFTLQELLALPQEHRGVHALSLPECLRWVLLAFPDMVQATIELFGVEPGQLEAGRGLSPEVAGAADMLAHQLVTLLSGGLRFSDSSERGVLGAGWEG